VPLTQKVMKHGAGANGANGELFEKAFVCLK